MKTQEEIKTEIEALKVIRPKVIPCSMFGDDNLASVDAQIEVLEQNLDSDDIYEKYDHANCSEYVLEAALETDNWRDGNSESDSLAADWPLKEGDKNGDK